MTKNRWRKKKNGYIRGKNPDERSVSYHAEQRKKRISKWSSLHPGKDFFRRKMVK